jgi:hypothetical protein
MNIMENKKSYISPQIELIELDNEISLALESTPPAGPSETRNDISTDSFSENPFMA